LYDVLVVGDGLGGASLGKALAEHADASSEKTAPGPILEWTTFRDEHREEQPP
jgi:hypothetical protein